MVILGIISFACVATFVWAYFHSKKDGTEEISWLWNDIDGRGIPVMFGLAIGAILSGVGVFLVYQFQGNYNTPDEQPGRAKVGLDAPVNHNYVSCDSVSTFH